MLEMSRIDRPSLGSLFHVLFPPRKIRGQEEIVPIFADLHASKNNFTRQIILSFFLSLPPSKCLLDFQFRGKIKKKKIPTLTALEENTRKKNRRNTFEIFNVSKSDTSEKLVRFLVSPPRLLSLVYGFSLRDAATTSAVVGGGSYTGFRYYLFHGTRPIRA